MAAWIDNLDKENLQRMIYEFYKEREKERGKKKTGGRRQGFLVSEFFLSD